MASALFTRWFQSKVFTPGFRLPTSGSAPDPWAAPAPTQRVLVDFIDLRRRLAPYVSSTDAARLAPAGGEAEWLSAANPKDYTRGAGRLRGFAFGPQLWIKPLPATEEGVPALVLPAETTWFDFWTGATYAGGQNLRISTPLDRLPLFARAGTILPLTPPTESGSTADNTLELRVYPGAKGRLELAEDPYGPNVLPSSEAIVVSWDDQTRQLRIGARPGPARPVHKPRLFRIVLVRPGHGVGHRPLGRPDHEIRYDGAEVCVNLPTPPACPRPPVGLTAKIQGDRIFFTWQRSCDGVIYRLKKVPGATSPFEDVASCLLDPEHTMPVPEGGDTFHYVVTAMNAGGESQPSASVQVSKTPESAPPMRLQRGVFVPVPADVRRPGMVPAPSALLHSAVKLPGRAGMPVTPASIHIRARVSETARPTAA